ncbi:uncharacterized protein LOC143848320 [Tasmannia lanceolata]|uniref:uncharacterized protein LOC143848320 n=1 Tax=Tasmannia lanceolata TaxID=3420 RepID=UPI0040630A67
MAAIGWYGPLIDLSQSSSYIGHYVQLLVFIHKSRPIEKSRTSNGGPLLKTDVQVGDDTRSYFPISVWHKHLGSLLFPGDIVLLQNVKIVKFGDVVEATTVQFSSLLLVHHYESLASKGIDELLADCGVGKTTKEKLKKVIEWVQLTGSILHTVQQSYLSRFPLCKDIAPQKRRVLKNWKVHEERKSHDCISILEVSSLTNSCNATFYGCIGEMSLPFTRRHDEEYEMEKMFVNKRLFMMEDNKIMDALICTGCKLCGFPLDSRSSPEQNAAPLYCQKSSNHLHVVCLIYRPFMLYVWDQSEHIPLLVKNKAAEILFGNITAESVYACYQGKKKDQLPDCEGNMSANDHSKVSGRGGVNIESLNVNESQQPKNTQVAKDKVEKKKPDLYRIWLILLKMILQPGNNSPFRFEVTVNCGVDKENGRFEVVTFSMPCSSNHGA